MPSFAPEKARNLSLLRVAEGGMGYVELVARHEGRFSRLFARKRLHPHLRADATFRAMFLDEARLAGLIRHPNVTGVVEVGEDEEGPFLLMDYVDGVSLAEVLERLEPPDRPLPLAFCVSVVAQAARGLHAAHELVAPDGARLRVVHRDISPKNLLLGYDGWVRVADFGIAKANDNVEQTMVGVLKGSIGYMAPEYLSFREVDQRSDLFALGVVLYELLTRERLYGAGDTTAIARRILEEPPPDIFETRDVPPELSALSFELLAKDRELRPPTALAVATQLDNISAGLAAVEGHFDIATFLEQELGELRAERQAVVDTALARTAAEATSPRLRFVELMRRAWRPHGARRTAGLTLAVVAAAALVFGAWGLAHWRTAVTIKASATELWGGGDHNCALSDGHMLCWGSNTRGQLGNGARESSGVPVQVNIGAVRAVALGENHTCALASDGHVACWGRNARGELGRETPRFSSQPLPVPGLGLATGLAVGRQHSCALLANAKVSCWGVNHSGQLGRPASENIEPPAEILELPPVEQVFAGGANTCARLVGGELRCWGANESGQLANGTRTQADAPIRVAGGEELVSLAIGNDQRAGSRNTDYSKTASFMCATTRSGSVSCWGNNFTGQLGDGTRESRATPAPVLGISDAIQVAAGDVHACALHRSGRVSCWGRNEFGALGDGSMGPSTVRMAPIAPIGVEDAVGIALGRAHSCVRLRNGGVRCWGVNNFGQIGDGSTLLRAAPVAVNTFP